MKSRYDGEIISDGSIKDGDSELVRTLKERQKNCNPSWKITEEAYAMLHLICLEYKDGIGVKLAKYILNKVNPEPRETIISSNIANFAQSLKNDRDPNFLDWLKNTEQRKTEKQPFPEDAVFRR